MNARYPNFDLLRLLLALEVVVAHGWYLSSEQFSWHGYVMAVPAFFAISGFLVLNCFERSQSWTDVLRKRALRLLPPVLLAMVLCWVLFGGLSVSSSFIYWISGGINVPGGMVNPPAWTLAWAFFAYLCMAFLWLAGAYKRPFVIWGLLAASLFVVHSGKHLDVQTQIILFLIPSFLIGNLACLHKATLLKVHPLIPWVFLIAVIFSQKIPYFSQLVGLSRVSFEAFAVVWVGMAGLRVLPFRIPDISYGLYIYHWPIAVYLDELKLTPTPTDMVLWLPLPLLVICLVSRYFVEKPALESKQPAGEFSVTDRYPNFDLLRVLLALEVVVAHAWYLTDPTFGSGGVIMAVPAFLAISGFLVLKSYEDSDTWGTFMRKRALRLLPALVVSMVLCWALFDGVAVYGAFINWISGGLFAPQGMVNTPLWSLAWEELAYLCLALLWTAGAYQRPWAIWILLSASMLIVYISQDIASQQLIILQLMPAFFIGNLAYLHRERLLKVDPGLPWLLLVMVILSPNIPFLNPLVNHNEATQVSFQAFAVVWVGMAGFRAVSFRFPDISYGLYIYHWPLIAYLLHHKLATTSTEMAMWLPIPLLAVCLASWYLVEKPALRLKPQGATGAVPQNTQHSSRASIGR